MSKYRIVAAVAALSLVGGAAGATAATHTKSATPQARFSTQLAKNLGVSDAKLRSATQSAGLSTVESLKASGKLKADRAAKLEKAIKAGRSVAFTQLGKARRGGARPLALAAKAIGAKPKDVRAALKAGKTPAAIITAAGQDPAAVKQTVKTAIRRRLDKGVKAGRLTAAQADARAEKAAARVTADQPLTNKHG